MASHVKIARTDVIAKLTAIMSGGVPLFQMVAVYNNQIARGFDGKGYSFPMPAAFIEVVTENTTQWGMGVTKSDLCWKVHIAHQQLDAGDGSLDQNLDVFDVRDAVKVALTKFRPANCGNMLYVGETPDHDHTNLYHEIMEFRSGFIDTKGSPLDPDSTEIITGQFNDVEVDRDNTLDVPAYENNQIINQEINMQK